MNILFISPHYLWGGASIANITIAKMLIANGHNVIYNDEYFPKEVFDDVKIDHTEFHLNRKRKKRVFINYVKDNKIDVIIWSPSMAIFYYSQLRKLRKNGVKHIAVVHSLSLKKNVKSYFVDLLTSFVLSKLDIVVFVSSFTKKSWRSFFPLFISQNIQLVINNPIIEPQAYEIHTHSLPTKLRVGFVGRFSEEKQPELFCRLSIYKDFVFHAWGEGPLMKKLKEKYSDVVYHGLETDISKIYSQIDIIVMTSKFENCPLVLLEAKTRGIPCVVPNVGGIPEIVKNGRDGLLYDKNEEASIVSKLYIIKDKYKEFSESCIASSSKFFFREIYSNWQNALNDIK